MKKILGLALILAAIVQFYFSLGLDQKWMIVLLLQAFINLAIGYQFTLPEKKRRKNPSRN
jgi:uncharacterized integral membrane protein